MRVGVPGLEFGKLRIRSGNKQSIMDAASDGGAARQHVAGGGFGVCDCVHRLWPSNPFKAYAPELEV